MPSTKDHRRLPRDYDAARAEFAVRDMGDSTAVDDWE
jgi:hypothetical protein